MIHEKKVIHVITVIRRVLCLSNYQVKYSSYISNNRSCRLCFTLICSGSNVGCSGIVVNIEDRLVDIKGR